MLDLLDLAQVENSSFSVNKVEFSLPKVIEDAFQVVKHFASTKNVTLVPPTLDEADRCLFENIEGDASRFQQILVNFLSNSLKFSQKNS